MCTRWLLLLPFLVISFATLGDADETGQNKVVADAAKARVSDGGAALDASADFDRQGARELIRQYCFDCHGDGADEGNLNLDSLDSLDESRHDPALWWKVLKNVRSGVMPPPGESRPTKEEVESVAAWIKFDLFGIDPTDPSPGRLVFRRLNRAEYGNTLRDLMGIEFDAALLFPADDSGHGFDNVGDALSISPMLMEKYFKAARMVVDEAIPKQTWIAPIQDFSNRDFRDGDGDRDSSGFDAKQLHQLRRHFEVSESGTYQLDLTLVFDGSFNFDPARYQLRFLLDDVPLLSGEYGWDDNKRVTTSYEPQLQVGTHEFAFVLTPVERDEPVDDEDSDSTSVRLEIDRLRLSGPIGTQTLVHPPNYERFFTREEPPESPQDRREYAGEVLRRFATRAFRHPVGGQTLDRLVDIAERAYRNPDVTFEQGVAQACVAVLSSPRFLFHLESVGETGGAEPESDTLGHGLISEPALAARLSYFLWSTLPDDELLDLARAGKLRANLADQIERMLRDDRADAFFENFVGQWLRTRDVSNSAVDPLAVHGLRQEYEDLLTEYRGLRLLRKLDEEPSDREQELRSRFREIRKVSERYGRDLLESMRLETELYVEDLIRRDGSLLDLIDSDHTFVNETLAAHYGIEGIEGEEMRRVELPAGSPRGGLITQGSMLLVTSNPTRTSPVKRGLFVLDNLLGTPAPPAPAGVPELEAANDQFQGRTPTLRELLAKHREAAICASCHARMDPLGLALENFNALGEWREDEHGMPIDPSGELISGEKFRDVRELKKVLRSRHADEFYRCVTEKLMTYAIGRGVEYGDQHSIDLIVDRLHASEGRFRVLLEGVIESAPFQKRPFTPSRVSTTSRD